MFPKECNQLLKLGKPPLSRYLFVELKGILLLPRFKLRVGLYLIYCVRVRPGQHGRHVRRPALACLILTGFVADNFYCHQLALYFNARLVIWVWWKLIAYLDIYTVLTRRPIMLRLNGRNYVFTTWRLCLSSNHAFHHVTLIIHS